MRAKSDMREASNATREYLPMKVAPYSSGCIHGSVGQERLQTRQQAFVVAL